MKHLPAFILMLLIVSCKNEPEINMVGAYALNTQVLNDGSKDSAIDRKQLKIYTDQYFMYASPNVADSFANFGIGKYKVEKDKLYEYRFYTAEQGEKSDTFAVTINRNADGYEQVIENMNLSGTNYKLTETYETTGSDLKSPLDGAWKQIRNVYITKAGDSSVNNNPLEYKVYQNGYFIWAITVMDSAKGKTSVFGYGPYEMVDSHKIKETVANSTFITGLLGKSYEVDIEYPTADTYKQTITFANGDKSVEVYQRLK
ncbi:MAG TPA: hypothetical protein VGD17_16255 [Chitinophagaceae bacterium]